MHSLAWLFPAALAIGWTCLALGFLFFPQASQSHRLLGGIVWTLGSQVLALQILFHSNCLTPSTWGAVTLAVTVLAEVGRRRARCVFKWHELRTALLAGISPVDVLASGAVGVALLAVFLLPIWQWDSLGYHLPFVNFVLQDGGHRGLPPDVPYLSTYPRNVELLFVALRATLPDDRLLDLGQLPLGLVGALATAGIARHLGASHRAARIAGILWLCTPAVFLQLPTNYIDVGVACFFLLAAFFLLLPATPLHLLSAGLAVGLFLGTKPNTPPAAALLGVVLLVRATRAGHARWGLAALLLSGALGLEAYVEQLIKHGNPVWPAIVNIGPWQLPGTIHVSELLSSGAGAEKVHGPLPWRMFASWTSLSATPVFDMRVGGLWLAFLLALPLALVSHRASLSRWAWLLAAVALVTPDPAVVRYILAFPALVFALAAGALTRIGTGTEGPLAKPWIAPTFVSLAALLAAAQLAYAFPGLTGEGPKLSAYFSMSDVERLQAVGANGRPAEYVEARSRLKEGDVALYDRSVWLPYLLWRSDFGNRVERIPDDASSLEIKEKLDRETVRFIVVGDDQKTRRAVETSARPYQLAFRCKESCSAYVIP